jgi:2-aminoethylphosphonate-pyruvate transaminase
MRLAPRRQVLFNPGPVNLDPLIKENLFNVELCHRQPEFEQLHERVRSRLLALYVRDTGRFALSLMHGSGTLAVDSGLASFVRGKVLVPDNGVYCRRLVRSLSAFEDTEVATCSVPIGTPLDLGAVEEALESTRPDWVVTVHHETSSGILNPMAELADLCDRHGSRLFVDAVSSFGVHEVDPRADVVCFNSSKCLESLPGVAAVLWGTHLTGHPTVPVLDVTAYAKGIPNTPNVQAMIALDLALDLLESEDRPARYKRLSQRVRDAGSRHFEPLLDEQHRSWVLTSFLLGSNDVEDLLARALSQDYVIYRGQEELGDEIFRVANMGAAIDEEAIEGLFAALSS